MTGDAWVVRPLGEDGITEMLQLDASAFHIDPPDDFLDGLIRPLLEPDRITGVRDTGAGDTLVATAAILSKRLTFPGGRPQPVAAVTYVAVRAGWRRRGLLRALMRDQLHGLHDAGGEPVAILTASEGLLYGRYGYGRAIDRAEFRLSHGAAFAPGTAVETVRELPADRAPEVLRGRWERVSPQITGHLSRTAADYGFRLSDHDFLLQGRTSKRWAVHPDGYAGYRVRPAWRDRDGSEVVVVQDLCAATPIAHASLWRFLLDLDLTDRVEYILGWVDDPLPDLLQDPRSLDLRTHDHVWLRIVDLDRTVGLRDYAVPASVDVEIVDDVCPWNAGTWHLELGPTGGTADRTGAAPRVRLHIRDLAACFLGGTPLARPAAAGLISGDPEAIGDLGLALSTPMAPWCPEGF
jgi:predicted acetyltransferase